MSVVHQHCFLFLLLICAAQHSEGLKMKLISPNSKQSPVYMPNLTTFEKIQRLFLQSRFRTQPVVRQPVSGFGDGLYDGLLYFAEIGVGSFGEERSSSFIPYLLAVDTGSELTWLQCEACRDKAKGNHCFSSIDPPFPNSRSLTFKPIKKHHNRCSVPEENNLAIANDEFCYYHIEYEDGSRTSGQLANETFTFESDSGDTRFVVSDSLMFGCGTKQTGFPAHQPPFPISGIVGLNRAKVSLPVQLDPAGVGLRFSYCLPDLIEHHHGSTNTYLRIGDDIPVDSSYLHTPLQQVPEDDSYFVKMIDIRVNGDRLRIPRSVFQVHNGSGGVVLDSGSSITKLLEPAYLILERYLIRMFSRNLNYRLRPRKQKLPLLCYDMVQAEGYKNLPSMAFILEDGDFEIGPEQAFAVAGGESPDAQQYFCLLMQPADAESTVIGAYQQVNHRLVYDIKQSKLWFKNADCATDP